MIDLKQLILIAPFPEDVKVQINAKMDSLTDVQKSDLEALAWDTIIEDYEMRISYETQKAISEVAQGVKKEEDLDKIEGDVFKELQTKLEGIATQEQIEEVRAKLQTQSPKAN